MEEQEDPYWLSHMAKAQPSRLRIKSISSIVDRLIVEKGYAAQQSMEVLREQWHIAVGDALFSQSRVGKIQRDSASVCIEHDCAIGVRVFQEQGAEALEINAAGFQTEGHPVQADWLGLSVSEQSKSHSARVT